MEIKLYNYYVNSKIIAISDIYFNLIFEYKGLA